jgi:hypothetical protein
MEKVAWQESFKTVMELKCRLTGINMPLVLDIPGRSEISKLERIESLEPRLRNDKMLFDEQLKHKSCDGKPVWNEMVRQFTAVHELASVRGLLLDVPDALSDINALDSKGFRMCRAPRAQVTKQNEVYDMEYAANAPLRKARERKPKNKRDVWAIHPASPKRKKIW